MSAQGPNMALTQREAVSMLVHKHSPGHRIDAIRVFHKGLRIPNATMFAANTMPNGILRGCRLQDIQLLLAAQCHLGTKNCDYQMERYIYKRRNDGIYIINLGKTWEKLQLAARVIVAIENPQDIVVQSARPYGQRAILKFAHYVNAKALSGRHTPGEPPTRGGMLVTMPQRDPQMTSRRS